MSTFHERPPVAWVYKSRDHAILSFGGAVTTGPNTGIDVIAPGRQDVFLRNLNPVLRSADISVAPPRPSNMICGPT
jgi:hypothetical protein